MKPTALERQLKLRFKDKGLLDLALVHPSYVNELKPAQQTSGSYERLEFLGDAVLDVVITLELFRRCPDLSEGQLTKLRSSLVRGWNLARIAKGMELGQHLKMGKGEESTGGRARDSNMAAAFEALVGAIFLDQGFDTATKFVHGMMSEEIECLLARGVPEDPKSRLQELVQGMGGSSPYYQLVEAGGPDHDKMFHVEVVMDGQVMGRGQGRRKTDAEREAAQEVLLHLETSTGV